MHFAHDLKQSLRFLGKSPSFTVTGVLVLALGIGVNTAIFSLVNALLLRPLSPIAPERLVGVYTSDQSKPDAYRAFSYPEYQEMRGAGGVFESLAAHNFTMLGLREGDRTRRVFGATISSNYFETLGVRLAMGRTFNAEEEAPGSGIASAVLSHALWKKLGADRTLVGRSVRVNGTDYSVVGVAPEGFTGTMALFSPELWIPFGMYDTTLNDFQRRDEHASLADREHRNLILFGRLAAGQTAERAAPQLAVVSERLARSYPSSKDQVLSLAQLPRLGVSTQPEGNAQVAAASGILMAMAGLVLLIACLNLANMLLARSEARRKEIAVRQALGAGRGRIVRQLLTEGLVLSLLGGIAGLMLAFWSTRLLVSSLVPLMPLDIVFRPEPDLRVLLATLGFCMAATLAFALGPAWKLSRTDALPQLKEHAGDPATGRCLRWFATRNLLVVGQVALSLALLATGGLFIRGAVLAAQADPGFSLERGLLLEVDPALAGDDEVRGRAVYAALLERLRALPEVEAASVASTVPFGPISIGRRVARAGAPDSEEGEPSQQVIVGADYFRSLGLPILRGRDFGPGDESGAGNARPAIIDEPLARKLWPEQDPVGSLIRLAGSPEGKESPPLEVVGVVPGLRHTLFDPAPVPHVYLPFGAHYQSSMNVHIRSRAGGRTAELALLSTVRKELQAADSRLPILSAKTLAGYRDESLPLWMVRSGARVFTLFGAVALLLAVVGVYGVKAFLVARRTREIGIRMALGATPGSVLRLVLREGMLLTGAGVAVGLLLALASGKLVSSMLYQVGSADPIVITVAPLLLTAAALLAAYLPARRATRVAAVTALRHE